MGMEVMAVLEGGASQTFLVMPNVISPSDVATAGQYWPSVATAGMRGRRGWAITTNWCDPDIWTELFGIAAPRRRQPAVTPASRAPPAHGPL